jgi:hypothetical protein
VGSFRAGIAAGKIEAHAFRLVGESQLRILSVAEDLTVLNPLMIARCGLRSRHIAILAWDRAERQAPQKAE